LKKNKTTLLYLIGAGKIPETSSITFQRKIKQSPLKLKKIMKITLKNTLYPYSQTFLIKPKPTFGMNIKIIPMLLTNSDKAITLSSEKKKLKTLSSHNPLINNLMKSSTNLIPTR
jgi:hypothetical protein